jgi:hypothetical protein
MNTVKMMDLKKHPLNFIFLIWFLLPLPVFGQHVAVNNACIFKDGIYTSFGELLSNAPRYLNCKLDIVRPPAGYPKYDYYDSADVRHTYHDSCFCVVANRILFVRDMDFFYKSYYLGAVTILQETTWHSAFQKDYETFDGSIFILDFMTGEVLPLNKKNVSGILARDSSLSGEFEAKKKKATNEEMVLYLLKYNSRNPYYLK